MTILTIALAILVFGILIFVHELGHFVAAKLSGIAVLQFNIGFGPVLIKKQWGETLYAIRIIPLGGAVLMKGADEEEELLVGKPEMNPNTDEGYNPRLDPASEVGSFFSASKLQRFAVCAAGPLMNVLFGILVLFFVYAQVAAIPVARIDGFAEGFLYESEQQLLLGDEIVRVNDFHIFTYSDLLTALTLGEGKPYNMTIKRDGNTVKLKDFTLTRETYGDAYRFGIDFAIEEIGVGGRLAFSADNAMSFMQSTVISLKMIVTGDASPKEMMGTIGIVTEVSTRAQQSLADMWVFVAFISINLAFVNLLPIPAVDGGKILFLGIEAIRGKRMNPKVEGYFSLAGLVFVLGLFLFVNINDIMRLIS